MSYVDEMLLLSDSEGLVAQSKKALNTSFIIRDLCLLKDILDVRTGRVGDGEFYPTQNNFLSNLLTEYDIQKCKHISTAVDPSTCERLAREMARTENECKETAGVRYQERTGRLLYLSTQTCPGTSVVVGVLSRDVSIFRTSSPGCEAGHKIRKGHQDKFFTPEDSELYFICSCRLGLGWFFRQVLWKRLCRHAR